MAKEINTGLRSSSFDKYPKVPAVHGIQKNHIFIPITANKLLIKRYSRAEISEELQI